jgi:co-chaperonin GroES (HSP10)
MIDIKPLGKTVIVGEMKGGERKIGRIVLADDDGKEHGVRPRWAKVKFVGKEVLLVKEGDWVLIEHGRWTRTFTGDFKGDDLRAIDYPDCVLLVSDTEPEDDMVMNSSEHGQLKRF